MQFGRKNRKEARLARAESKNNMTAGKRFAMTFLKTLLACLMLVVIGGGIAGCTIIQRIVSDAPDLSKIDPAPTQYLSVIKDVEGNETARLVAAGSNRIYVPLYEVPMYLQHAFVAIEDSRFYQHNGIDFRGILRAGWNGITSGSFDEGASTITQQLIKNNLFPEFASGETTRDRVTRKIQEWYLAIELSRNKSKDWVMENYLNTINLGQNTLGVQAASQRYFGKNVSELTLSESAVIAAITQNPSKWNPITHPENNEIRRLSVLDHMLDQGFITRKEHDDALSDDVYARIQQENIIQEEESGSNVYSYFVDALIDDITLALREMLGYTPAQAWRALYQGGLTIESTQDPALQAICDEEVNNPDNYPKVEYSMSYRLTVNKADGTVKNFDERSSDMPKGRPEPISNGRLTLIYPSIEAIDAAIEKFKSIVIEEGDSIPENGELLEYSLQPQTAITVIDQNTGEVKAITGGRGEKTRSRSLNRATQTTRQPGSTFKPLGAFAPGLDAAGMTLATVQDDAPYNYLVGGQPVRNYDGRYRGFISMREAIAMSVNIYTVKCGNEVGPDLAYDYLTNGFQFSTLDPEQDLGESMPLGGLTYGVTNLELTAAYAAIANGGVYTRPKFFSRILDHDGNVLIDNEPQTHVALKDTTAYLLVDAMKDVFISGTGSSFSFPGMTIAGKTGTTTDNRDSLLAGFSPYYTAIGWGGFDDNSAQSEVAFPRIIWQKVMQRIHQDLANKDFDRPSSIQSASVCYKSGYKPLDGICSNDPRGSQVRSELFALGTVPEEFCNHHAGLQICQVSHLPVSEYCPQSVRSTRIFIVGGSPGSEDGPYLLTEQFAHSICNIHTGLGMTLNPAPNVNVNETTGDPDAENITDDTNDYWIDPEDTDSGDGNHGDTAPDISDPGGTDTTPPDDPTPPPITPMDVE